MTQEELNVCLDSIRGSYSNGFFSMYINGSFDSDLNEMNDVTDRGTVVHEYIHYIQNIATLWGLYESITRYDYLLEFKNAIVSESEINRPYQFQFSDKLKKRIEYINIGRGYCKNENWVVDLEKPIETKSNIVELYEESIELVMTTFYDENGVEHKIQLGSFIIKESMAAMYQELIDPQVQHNDLPYNFVKIIASQKYPKTSSDIRKLICACHASLFSMNPGNMLLQILDEMEANQNLNGFDYFSNFVSNKHIIKRDSQETLTINDYFNEMVNGFLTLLNNNINAEIIFIKAVLNRAKLDNLYYPILSVLYEDNGVNCESFTDIMKYYGIPYVHANNNCFFPIDNEEQQNPHLDVLELVVIEAIINSMTRKENQYVCPLYYMCKRM